MKLPKTLQTFWEIPFQERTNYYISEDLVKGYPIVDTKEPLVDVEVFFATKKFSIAYMPPDDIEGLITTVRLRETVTHMLFDAAKKLPDGFIFALSEGYRPLWYQRKNFEEIYAGLKQKMPSATEKELYDETTTYIADPNLCPPHSTGGAMDITILDEKRNALDMGAPMNTVGEISNTFTEGLSKKAQENRQLLFDILTSVRFVNLASEWWHYSYGDQYWAIFNQKDAALYDKIDVE